MNKSRAIYSSKSDHWATPAHVYEDLNREFNFTFDPCPLMSSEDGRKVKWTGRVFCNPPYSDVDGFLRKGLYHLANGDCELLVYLLPSTTGNGWFHDYCLKGEVRFIRGRLRFGGAKYTAPFWSCIVIFREWSIDALPLDAAPQPSTAGFSGTGLSQESLGRGDAAVAAPRKTA